MAAQTKAWITALFSSTSQSTLQMKMDWYDNCWTCTSSTEVTKRISGLSHSQRACFCTLLTQTPPGFKIQWTQQGRFGEWGVLNRALMEIHNVLVIMLHYSLLHHTSSYKQHHIKDQSSLKYHNSRRIKRKKAKKKIPKTLLSNANVSGRVKKNPRCLVVNLML